MPYHYDHSTRTGTVAAATPCPRNPTDSPRSKVTHRTHRTRRTPLQLTRWPMASWDAHRKLSFASSWLSSTAVDRRRAAPRYARAGAPGSGRTARACDRRGAAWDRSQRRRTTAPAGWLAAYLHGWMDGWVATLVAAVARRCAHFAVVYFALFEYIRRVESAK